MGSARFCRRCLVVSDELTDVRLYLGQLAESGWTCDTRAQLSSRNSVEFCDQNQPSDQTSPAGRVVGHLKSSALFARTNEMKRERKKERKNLSI